MKYLLNIHGSFIYLIIYCLFSVVVVIPHHEVELW